MKLRTVREVFKSGSTYTLYPLGDIHLGSANCDKDRMWQTVNAIRSDPLARWVGMGDYCEWITPKDKRWQGGGIDEAIIDQGALGRIGDVYVEKIASILRPIMDKCLAFGIGNHEERFEIEHETNLCQRILQESGAPGDLYSGWAGLTRILWQRASERSGRAQTIIYHSHGWQAGRMDGAKINQMERLPAWVQADIYLHGHSHSSFVKPVARLKYDGRFERIAVDVAYTAHTGSFLRTYQQDQRGYGEVKGYPPTVMGPPRFRITPVTGHQTRTRIQIEAVT